MKRATSSIAALWCVAACAVLVAQGRPNFTGKWTFVPEKSVIEVKDGPNPVRSLPPYGLAFSATQDAAGLTIQSTQSAVEGQPPAAPQTFKFDGTELKTTTPAAAGRSAAQAVNTAAWNGRTLVITTLTTRTIQGGVHTSKAVRTLSIGADGSLVVDIKSELDGVPAPPLRAVYKRA